MAEVDSAVGAGERAEMKRRPNKRQRKKNAKKLLKTQQWIALLRRLARVSGHCAFSAIIDGYGSERG